MRTTRFPRNIRLVIAFASLFFLALVGGSVFRNSNAGIVRSVQEQEGCTLATLQGTYLFTVRLDNRSNLPDPRLPGVVAGVRTFDGAGNLSQVASDSMSGVITHRIAATWTYTLD